MPEGSSWTLIRGDGLAVEGPCLLLGLIFWPDADADYVDVYDGHDATSGKLFCRIETPTSLTWSFCFGSKPRFDGGIYVDGIDGDVETTVIYEDVE